MVKNDICLYALIYLGVCLARYLCRLASICISIVDPRDLLLNRVAKLLAVMKLKIQGWKMGKRGFVFYETKLVMKVGLHHPFGYFCP